MFRGEPSTRSAEAGLRLINDKKRPKLFGEFLQRFQVAWGRDDHATGREDRFDDYGCDVAGSRQSSFYRSVQTGKFAFGVSVLHRAMKAVWRKKTKVFWNGRSRPVPVNRRKNGTQTFGGERKPVITTVEANDSVFSGVGLR